MVKILVFLYDVTLGHAEGKMNASPIIDNNVSIKTNVLVVGDIRYEIMF